MFQPQSSKPDFRGIQQSVSTFWSDNHIFEQSVEQRPASDPYRFYDGPPFITGLPHYGHLASSVAKDVIPRYQTMKGKRVERVRGRDCHGIPIEQKVQKKLGLTSGLDIERVGVDTFVQECYAYTHQTSSERDRYVENFGRWVDMDNAYKTMDNDYMESVRRVFQQIRNKGLIYKGKRVSLYSTKLETPISNFEVAMDDSYEEVNDPAITVRFPITQTPERIDAQEGGSFEYTDDGHLRYVLAVIKDDQDRILMLKNAKHGGKRQCPGGKIDEGETAQEALTREVKEELGVECKIVQHLFDNPVFTGALWQGEYYEVTLNGKPSVQEPHKHTALERIQFVETDTDLGWITQTESETIDDEALLRQTYDFTALQTKTPFSKVYALAWTTTPWTIPTNIALGVNEELMYAMVLHEGDAYLVAEARVDDVFKGKEYTLAYTFPGSWLVGVHYTPPFDYFTDESAEDRHRIVHAEFATDESGTGIVHQAPEFGEDDFNLAKEEGLLITEVMNKRGEYTDQLPDLSGTYFRDANDELMMRLKESSHLFDKASITHRVAFCPRTSVPLVYKAQDSWFIDIQSIKDRLIAANEQINWYPEHFKHGRFLKSIESAPDRGISRTRYRGTPMPVYVPASALESGDIDPSQAKVIGSREELFNHQSAINPTLTKFTLIRHGESVKNIEGRNDIRGESPLTERGQEQAKSLSATLPVDTKPMVYISPMPRTFQTILPYLTDVLGLDGGTLQQEFDKQLQQFHVIYDTGNIVNYIINEEGPVQFDLTDNVCVDRRLTETLITHNHGPDAPKKPCDEWNRYEWSDPISPDGGSETMNQLRQRALSFVESVAGGQHAIAVTHGDTFLTLLSVLKGQGEEGYGTFRNKYYPQKASTRDVYYLPATGVELDLHRPYIDQVQLEIGGERYVRIPEVLDCWMESGAMPYGQMHYPFENKEKMEASFPADYIVEYTGQIRARFYVMHVLGVILFDKPAYKNVVCHGVVAGNDGRKMSKSLGNFPDPKLTFEQYGGDAVRMSILTSPLFNAGDTSITEQSIAEALRGSILPLWNAFSFFVTYARIDGWTPSDDVTVSDNVLDQWIVGELQLLIQQLSTDLDAYDLQSSSRALGVFLDQLTNWYIRRSRRRFRKSESDTDKDQAYATLYRVLVDFTKVAAPFAPFICEYIYRELKKGTEGTKVAEGEQGEQGEQGANDISVHLTDWLEADEGLIDTDLSESMALTQRVVRMGLAWRSQHDIRVRQPLAALTIGQELDSYYMDIIAEELNIKSVQVDMDVNDRVTQICKPDGKVVGPIFGRDVKAIFSAAKSGDFEIQSDGSAIVAGQWTLPSDGYEISYVSRDGQSDANMIVDDGLVLVFDSVLTDELLLEGDVRDLVRAIQDARKQADYDIADRISLSLSGSQDYIDKLTEQFGEYLQHETLSVLVEDIYDTDIQGGIELREEVINFCLSQKA